MTLGPTLRVFLVFPFISSFVSASNHSSSSSAQTQDLLKHDPFKRAAPTCSQTENLFHSLSLKAPKKEEPPVCCLVPLEPIPGESRGKSGEGVEEVEREEVLLSFGEWKEKQEKGLKVKGRERDGNGSGSNSGEGTSVGTGLTETQAIHEDHLDLDETSLESLHSLTDEHDHPPRLLPHFQVPLHDRFNYASLDCSARVHTAHRSAKSASNILSSKKDRYLLSPCASRTPNERQFVVVELCEDIRIDTVQLANFEFFSGVFRDFTVSVAKTYVGETSSQTDDWVVAGTYRAKNVRGVQSFRTAPSLTDFYRFIRIDFHSHYSNEYYCPVSLLRVYGLTHLEEWKWEMWETESRARAEREREAVFGVREEDPVENYKEDDTEVGKGVEKDDVVESTLMMPQGTRKVKVEGPATRNVVTGPLPEGHYAKTTTKAHDNDDNDVHYDATAEVASSTIAVNPIYIPGVTPITSSTSTSSISKLTSSTSASSVSTSLSESVTSTSSVSLVSSATETTTTVSLPQTNTKAHNDSLASLPASSASPIASQGPVSPDPLVPLSSSSSHPSSHSHSSSSNGASHIPSSSTQSLSITQTHSQPHLPPLSTHIGSGGGESIYRTIMNRLGALEGNHSLYTRYVEQQTTTIRAMLSRISEDVGRLEGISKSHTRLRTLEFERLAKRLGKVEAEYMELMSRVEYLSDEIVLEKRLGIAQLCLLLAVIVFMVLTRGSRGELDHQQHNPLRLRLSRTSMREWGRRHLSISLSSFGGLGGSSSRSQSRDGKETAEAQTLVDPEPNDVKTEADLLNNVNVKVEFPSSSSSASGSNLRYVNRSTKEQMRNDLLTPFKTPVTAPLPHSSFNPNGAERRPKTAGLHSGYGYRDREHGSSRSRTPSLRTSQTPTRDSQAQTNSNHSHSHSATPLGLPLPKTPHTPNPRPRLQRSNSHGSSTSFFPGPGISASASWGVGGSGGQAPRSAKRLARTAHLHEVKRRKSRSPNPDTERRRENKDKEKDGKEEDVFTSHSRFRGSLTVGGGSRGLEGLLPSAGFSVSSLESPGPLSTLLMGSSDGDTSDAWVDTTDTETETDAYGSGEEGFGFGFENA